MNVTLENNIIERLHYLDDVSLHKVLDFIQSIHTQPQTLPKMTGLFSHLKSSENEINTALEQTKLDQQTSLKNSLDNL
jgi:hypothetical protein